MTGSSAGGPDRVFDILLVQSETTDIGPFVDSFESTDVTNEVHVVSDGNAALEFLRGRDEYADAPRPDIIVLDLHLPGMSGEEILAELDEHPEWRPIPVLVVTETDAEEDVARSYELNANAYLQKPDDPEEFAELAQAIEDFWLRVVKMPPKW